MMTDTMRNLSLEIRESFRSFPAEEIPSILKAAFFQASRETWDHKKRALAATGRFLADTAKKTTQWVSTAFRNGMEKTIHTEGEKIRLGLLNMPAKMRSRMKEFLDSPRDRQIDILTDIFLGLLVFGAASGGMDAEGGLPDLDLKTGIGNHRNVFSHTILIGISVEFFSRFCLSVFGQALDRSPEGSHPVLERIRSFADSKKDLAAGAMWAGLAVHLLKDASLFSSRTKPYTGLPVSIPMEGHQGLCFLSGYLTATCRNI